MCMSITTVIDPAASLYGVGIKERVAVVNSAQLAELPGGIEHCLRKCRLSGVDVCCHSDYQSFHDNKPLFCIKMRRSSRAAQISYSVYYYGRRGVILTVSHGNIELIVFAFFEHFRAPGRYNER